VCVHAVPNQGKNLIAYTEWAANKDDALTQTQHIAGHLKVPTKNVKAALQSLRLPA